MKSFLCLALAVAVFMTFSGCSHREAETLQKVDTLMEAKDYPKALDLIQNHLQQDPTNKKFLRKRVLFMLKTDRVDLAINVYRDMAEKNYPHDAILFDALKDKDAVIRSNAARAFALLGDASALPALTNAVKDPDDNVRRAAVFALGELKSPKSFPILIDALQDKWWFVRLEAIHALGCLKDSRAIEPLFAILLRTGEDKTVTISAKNTLLGLIQKGQEGNESMYLAHLQETEPEVRHVAAVALASVRNEAAIPVLQQFTHAPLAPMRALTLVALSQFKDPKLLAVVQEGLKDADPIVREQTIRALAVAKDTTALPAIRALASNKNETPKLRGLAEIAERQITEP